MDDASQNNVLVPEEEQVFEPDGMDLKDETGQEALLSRIPTMAGGPKTADAKATYLGYRATGFPIRQACYLTDINQSTLGRWRKDDGVFADFESNRLPELQASVGDDLVRLGFMRNMRLALETDFKVLYKAVRDMQALTDREYSYLKGMRKQYSAQDLMAVNKVMAPEGGGHFDFSEMVLRVTESRTTMEVHVAKEPHTEEPKFIEAESGPA